MRGIGSRIPHGVDTWTASEEIDLQGGVISKYRLADFLPQSPGLFFGIGLVCIAVFINLGKIRKVEKTLQFNPRAENR